MTELFQTGFGIYGNKFETSETNIGELQLLMMNSFALSFESPVGVNEVKRRRLDPELSRIILESNFDDRDHCSIFSEYLMALKGDRDIWVTSIGEFRTLSNIEIEESEEIRVAEDINCLSIGTKPSLDRILRDWRAECLVVMYGRLQTIEKIVSTVDMSSPRFWQLSVGGWDKPFLDQIALSEQLGFFSDSRQSLEVFGDRYSLAQSLAEILRFSK